MGNVPPGGAQDSNGGDYSNQNTNNELSRKEEEARKRYYYNNQQSANNPHSSLNNNLKILKHHSRTRSEPPMDYSQFVLPEKKPSVDMFFPMLRLLGKGSFGKVVLVQKRMGRDIGSLFAMKILKKEHLIQKRQVERTKTERKVLTVTNHPFIMKLHFAFQSESKLFFVLDYCPGGELFFHLSRYRRFPEKVMRFYACELLLALGHLHDHGIVYRDLKPENVLLDAEGHVKLGDFGLAKDEIWDPCHGAKSLCGTPEYMAPEVLRQQGHGLVVDYWGLGMVCYEMLTGLPPWYTTDRAKLFKRLKRAPLNIPPFFSEQVADFISWLLERNPFHRLGVGGVQTVMSHPFFYRVNWVAAVDRELIPPIRPCDGWDSITQNVSITNDGQLKMLSNMNKVPSWQDEALNEMVSNFDEQVTRLPVKTDDSAQFQATLNDSGLNDDEIQDIRKYPGFSYQKDGPMDSHHPTTSSSNSNIRHRRYPSRGKVPTFKVPPLHPEAPPVVTSFTAESTATSTSAFRPIEAPPLPPRPEQHIGLYHHHAPPPMRPLSSSLPSTPTPFSIPLSPKRDRTSKEQGFLGNVVTEALKELQIVDDEVDDGEDDDDDWEDKWEEDGDDEKEDDDSDGKQATTVSSLTSSSTTTLSKQHMKKKDRALKTVNIIEKAAASNDVHPLLKPSSSNLKPRFSADLHEKAKEAHTRNTSLASLEKQQIQAAATISASGITPGRYTPPVVERTRTDSNNSSSVKQDENLSQTDSPVSVTMDVMSSPNNNSNNNNESEHGGGSRGSLTLSFDST